MYNLQIKNGKRDYKSRRGSKFINQYKYNNNEHLQHKTNQALF